MPASTLVPPYVAGAWIVDGTVQLKSILGVGGYAFVYHALDHATDPPVDYAVKCVLHSNQRLKNDLLRREIHFHTLASGSPNIVPVRRIVRESDRTFIFMDLCRGGDLYDAIMSNKRFEANDALIKQVFLQVIDAVMFLHRRKIYHRDIKPENIIFTDATYSTVMLTDFGLATGEACSTEFSFGSNGYMAPECFSRDFNMESKYSCKQNDVWALGCLLFNMISGRTPWGRASLADGNFSEYRMSQQWYLVKIFPISPQVNALLLRMLALDYRERISLSEVRAAISRIDYFSGDWDDYLVDEYVLDLPLTKPAHTIVASTPEPSPPLLAAETFASTGATPFSPASAGESSSQDYFFARGWRSYVTPPASDETCTTPSRATTLRSMSSQSADGGQCPTPAQSPRRSHVALRRVARRQVHRIDSFGLPVLSGVVNIDDVTGARPYWSSDSESGETADEVHARPAFNLPTPPPSSPTLSTVPAVPGKHRKGISAWLKMPFRAIRKRRPAVDQA